MGGIREAEIKIESVLMKDKAASQKIALFSLENGKSWMKCLKMDLFDIVMENYFFF